MLLQQQLVMLVCSAPMLPVIFFGTDDDEDYFDEDDSIIYPESRATIYQPAPSFSGSALKDGEFIELNSKDYLGKYVVLLFYPKDFTFVCPTEITAYNDRLKEFQDLGAEVIACSTDTVNSHLAWTRMSRTAGGLGKMDIPILGDHKKVISSRYGVLHPEDGVCLRGIFIIDPKGDLQQMTLNNLDIGRNVDETLRLIKALKFVEQNGVVCPANWQPGEKTMIANPKDSMEYFSTLDDNETESSSNSLLQNISTYDEFETSIKSDSPTVAYFNAPYCEKCKQIAPFVEDLAKEHEDKINFIKIDTSKLAFDETSPVSVETIPHFRFFKNGKDLKDIIEPVTGYKKRPLKAQVEKLLN